MSDTSGKRIETIESDTVEEAAYDKPAIGLKLGKVDPGVVARTILRAKQHDFHVIVTISDGADPEGRAFAEELGATIIDVDQEEHARQTLSSMSRKLGFPGLLYCDTLSERIDFEASQANLFDSDDYTTQVITIPETSKSDRIFVGIPAANEEIAIASVVLTANKYADEVIVVDDGSSDRTAELARDGGATVLQHPQNMGKGASIKTLFSHMEEELFDVLVLLDGDGQHSACEIQTVVDPILNRDVDMVIGSRYLDKKHTDTPRYRRFGQSILDLLTIGSSRHRVSDSQSGFRALSAEAVRSINLTTNGYGVESEMIESAVRADLEIEEVPVEVRYDDVDGSNLNPVSHGVSVMVFILQLIRNRHPLLFFGLPGVVIMTFGILYGIEGIILYEQTGNFHPTMALISGFVTIVGVISMFIGLVLNSVNQRIDEMQVG